MVNYHQTKDCGDQLLSDNQQIYQVRRLSNSQNIYEKVGDIYQSTSTTLNLTIHQFIIRLLFEANGKLYWIMYIPFSVTNGVSGFQRTVDAIVAKGNRSMLTKLLSEDD